MSNAQTAFSVLVRTEQNFIALLELLLECRKRLAEYLPAPTISTLFDGIDEICVVQRSLLSDLVNASHAPSLPEHLLSAFTRYSAAAEPLYGSYITRLLASRPLAVQLSNTNADFTRLTTPLLNDVTVNRSASPMDILLLRASRRPQFYGPMLSNLLADLSAADLATMNECIATCDALAARCGSEDTQREAVAAMARVSSSIMSSTLDDDPLRTFIRSGTISWVAPKKTQARTLFLFSDRIILAKTIGKVHMCQTEILLAQCDVRDLTGCLDSAQTFVDGVSAGSGSGAFGVRGLNDSFIISTDDASQWMAQIAAARTRLQPPAPAAEQLRALWIPDSLAAFCMTCGCTFTFINRRHHCRECGSIICGKCSTKKQLGQEMERVCVRCAAGNTVGEQMTQQPAQETVQQIVAPISSQDESDSEPAEPLPQKVETVEEPVAEAEINE